MSSDHDDGYLNVACVSNLYGVLLLDSPLSIAGPPIFAAAPPFIQTSAGSRYLDYVQAFVATINLANVVPNNPAVAAILNLSLPVSLH
jgi:hypothetical protein